MLSTSCQQDLKIKAKGVGRFSIMQIDIMEYEEIAFLYVIGNLEVMSISFDQILYIYMFSKFKAMPLFNF